MCFFGLFEFGVCDGVLVIMIEQFIVYLNEIDLDGVILFVYCGCWVSLCVDVMVLIDYGVFCFFVYKDRVIGMDYIVVVFGEFGDMVFVCVYFECLIGEVFGFLKCECGLQFDVVFDVIEQDGGIVIYMCGYEG